MYRKQEGPVNGDLKYKRKANKLDMWGRRRAAKYGVAKDDCSKHIYSLLKTSIECPICGRTMKFSMKSLDHLVPLSKGGGHVIGNLRITCSYCNCWKGDAIEHGV